MRRTSMLVGFIAVTFATRLTALGQTETPRFSLPDLQASLVHQLLHVHDSPLAPVVDHLWKSNGGALLPRTVSNADSAKLAMRLSQLVVYDADSSTLYWPVLGFHHDAGLRFSPLELWSVVEPYFHAARFDGDELILWRDNFASAHASRPVRVDPLAPPAALTMPAYELLCLTGHFGSALFVYSPQQCFELAEKCYRLGLVHDARVLLSHAIAQSPQAKFYYLRGTIEIRIGLSDDATMSALGYIAATTPPAVAPPSYAYERINGPPAIQFRELVAELLRR